MTDSLLHTRSLTAEPGLQPLVFLHGLFGQGKNFATAAKQVSDLYQPVLVDLPNHGRSFHTDTFSYRDMADAVARTITESISPDGAPVHLLGHSMGGKVAMILALEHPELVDKLIVEDISPVSTSDMSEFDHLLSSLKGLDTSSLASRSEADEALAESVHSAMVRGFLLQNLRRDGDDWTWLANLDLLHAELDAIGGFPSFDTSFEGPVLWMAGEESPYIRPEHRPTMDALFPNLLQVTIKDANHWIHSVQPDAFVSALRTFLQA